MDKLFLILMPYVLFVATILCMVFFPFLKITLVLLPFYTIYTLFFWPKWSAVTVGLMVLWVLILLGGGLADGFAKNTGRVPKVAIPGLVIFSLGLMLWMISQFDQDYIRADFYQLVSMVFICFLVSVLVSYFGLLFVIAPIFVKAKDRCERKLVQCYAEKRGKSSQYMIKFQGDVQQYSVSMFWYAKLKGKLDQVFTYDKCFAICNMIYIKGLKEYQADDVKTGSYETFQRKESLGLGFEE